ncbi:hypothetical protein [Loktanella salsilacus]|uniref:hypothetical protein n=1 Tax=Loktanella salsilacus TaxID=195913 RepID=UPI0037351F1B
MSDKQEAEIEEEIDFEPADVGAGSSPVGGDLAEKEAEQFGKKPEKNTVVIPLWKGGYVSFNPNESVPIFALLALILLLGVVILLSFIGIWLTESSWVESLATALGHAITGVVGAIVGSAATKSK